MAKVRQHPLSIIAWWLGRQAKRVHLLPVANWLYAKANEHARWEPYDWHAHVHAIEGRCIHAERTQTRRQQ